MLIERYLAESLTKQFGHIVEGLDADKVRLSTWKGQLELRDVVLKRDALQNILEGGRQGTSSRGTGRHVPIEIAYGRIGTLQAKLPWQLVRRQIVLMRQKQKGNDGQGRASGAEETQPAQHSEKLSVVLSDVNILLTPKRRRQRSPSITDDYDDEEGEDPSAKEKDVQVALDAQLLRRVTESSQQVDGDKNDKQSAATRSGQWWFVRQLVVNQISSLLSQLVVTVENIHIRYEDNGCSMGFIWNNTSRNLKPMWMEPGHDGQVSRPAIRYRPPFAIGITLREFSVVTPTDNKIGGTHAKSDQEVSDANSNVSNTDDGAIRDRNQIKRKRAAAKDLSAYWDSDCKTLMTGLPLEEKDEDDYYRSMFTMLNDPSAENNERKQPHAYVLNPFSPEVDLSLLQAVEGPAVSSSTIKTRSSLSSSIITDSYTGKEGKSTGRTSPRAPPSRQEQSSNDPASLSDPSSKVQLSLPSCSLVISRGLLEDLGYLRKSLAVSRDQQVLSETTLRRLMRVRPHVTALEDPRAWWKYATEAIIILHSDNPARKKSHGLLKGRGRASVGWISLARALSQRKRYAALYEEFLLSDDVRIRTRAHLDLLDLERRLSVDEIVAFRISSYTMISNGESHLDSPAAHFAGRVNAQSRSSGLSARVQSSTSSDDEGDNGVDPLSSDEAVLSLDHRARMYLEMARALESEETNVLVQGLEHDRDSSAAPSDEPAFRGENDLVLSTSLSCPAFSVQVNDSTDDTSLMAAIPVARLSCAVMVQQKRFRDGSWNISNRIGSLKVEDCTPGDSSRRLFPNLIGPKGGVALMEHKTLVLDGTSYHESIQISVERSPHTNNSGTTTKTTVRVLPLEVVYSTVPVEALSRILSSANLEFARDYHQMSSRLVEWRRRQQKRLLRALAHREKRIIVDIDVGAPVFLMPEEGSQDSSLLVIDFGRLQFRNDDRNKDQKVPKDDRWRLDLTNVQAQCSSTYRYRRIMGGSAAASTSQYDNRHHQQLVEPFTLDFAITTAVRSGAVSNDDRETCVQVLASLPRLAVNITASAMRLLRRLQGQWDRRKVERDRFMLDQIQRDPTLQQGWWSRYFATDRGSRGSGERRTIQFHFLAPLLKFRFENDVDGRDCGMPGEDDSGPSTPLVDLVMKGIDAKLFNERTTTGETKVSWDARLRALNAVDLYQGAGNEFALLLSSVSPDTIIDRSHGEASTFAEYDSATDLLTFSYESQSAGVIKSSDASSVKVSPRSTDSRRLSIKFFELYVEWNPETLAALHLAMNLPREMASESDDGSSDDEKFFDAAEEEFFDAELDSPHALSKMFSGSDLDSFLDFRASESFFSAVREGPTVVGGIYGTRGSDQDTDPVSDGREFEIVFELSKLRVNFNKETRHRRLIIAEMDRTFVRRQLKKHGGSTTSVSIGNLTFSDADSLRGKTLYREILGLKTDSVSDGEGSLLEMELVRNKRTRQYLALDDVSGHSDVIDESVVINLSDHSVKGCDTFVKARFSPMRFVYLQQLWFEIVDYFFEGIVGYEVWGNARPAGVPLEDPSVRAPNADKMTFTRFDVVLANPVILFPVSYCSTDFIRLEANAISLSNHYTCTSMRSLSDPSRVAGKLQWYNNCDAQLDGIVLFSWSGRLLSNRDDCVSGSIEINWPTGPTALLNSPKWNVDWSMDALHVDLQPADYALLQHIIQRNIGEESRHLDEWHVLQNLPPLVLNRYKQDIMVHFGYDKKDVTPTTFDVTLKFPFVFFTLRGEHGMSNLQCAGITWRYLKTTDLVSRQIVTCDVEIRDVERDGDMILMSSNLRELSEEHDVPDLTYTSTTQPNSDNLKTLDVLDPQILLLCDGWTKLALFFRSMPEPNYLDPAEVIQVGDRWYKIGAGEVNKSKEAHPRFSWLSGTDHTIPSTIYARKHSISFPSSEFRASLQGPSIMIGSDRCGLIIRADQIFFRHTGRHPLVERDFELSGVEFLTRRRGRVSEGISLFDPWLVQGSTKKCNGRVDCQCNSHSFDLTAASLTCKASYSDVTVAAEVGLRFAREWKDSRRLSDSVAAEEIGKDSKPPTLRQDIIPRVKILCVRFDGFELTIIDDSGRHFAHSQELTIISVGMIKFERTESMLTWSDAHQSDPILYKMQLCIEGLDIVDCLQSQDSPFRKIATIRAANAILPSHLREPNAEIEEAQYAVELLSVLDSCRRYEAKVRSVELQYNPTLVIALQRFLGRLSKDVRFQLHSIFTENLNTAREDTPGQSGHERRVMTAEINVDQLRISLNKEHQGRQLLETALSDCCLHCRRSAEGIAIGGHLGLLDAWENEHIGGSGLNILKVDGGKKGHFVDFNYRTFSRRTVGDAGKKDLPDWVLDRVATESGQIDDCLMVSIASLEFIYVKEITLELLDYLSNGMPGRGMGVTSRAAKGFVNKRIQTKSFFQIHVDAPKVLMPQNQLSDSGLSCRLGDLNLKSWVREDLQESAAKRILAIQLSGLSAGMYDFGRSASRVSSFFSKVDVSVDVEKARSRLVLQAGISDIDVVIRYSDLVAFLSVWKENLSFRIEKTAWDNLEVAWENEELQDSMLEASSESRSPKYSKEVTYSESARHVRYGQPKKASDSERPSVEVDLRVNCEKTSLVLHRNDEVARKALPLSSGYDLVLLVVQRLHLSVKRSAAGAEALSVGLGKVHLFDVGESGRVSLGSSSGLSAGRPPSCFVMVEGYPAPEGTGHFDSQVVLNIDRLSSSKSKVDVSILVNYLSITALLRPLEEVVAFASGSWTTPGSEPSMHDETESLEGHAGASFEGPGQAVKSSRDRHLNLKFVLHYPRFVFVADENDRHSRALVLEGLAMVNASLLTGHTEIGDADHHDEAPKTLSKFHADFQDICSYINPDVACVTAVRPVHLDLVRNFLPNESSWIDESVQMAPSSQNNLSHGIPLLLPLTIGIEYEQKMFHRLPAKRSLNFNVDSLSMMMSRDDVLLIQSVVRKWSRKSSSQKKRSRTYVFDVVFETEKLGLGLRKDGNRIVVDHVGVAAREKSIERNDSLYSINGTAVSNIAGTTLSDMVELLSSIPRPLTITFARTITKPEDEAGLSSDSFHGHESGEVDDGTLDHVEVILSTACLRIMEKDLTLLRAKAYDLDLGCWFERTSKTTYRVSVRSKLEMDYYNLRIWAWEPLLERGEVFVSGEYQNPHQGPKELSVEMGDLPGGPLCLNISDAAVETLSKFSGWKSKKGNDRDMSGDVIWVDGDDRMIDSLAHDEAKESLVSTKAANAALLFAQRQVNDSAKPFVFENRTGVSVAFMLQKNVIQGSLRRSESFNAVGEYEGLQGYSNSEVTVVANAEEAKFRVDVSSDGSSAKRGRRFPPLLVSVQSVGEYVVGPLRDLDISVPGATTFPLSIGSEEEGTEGVSSSRRQWITWDVDHRDDRTVLCLGTSVKVVSLLQDVIEFAVVPKEGNEDDRNIKSIGTSSSGSSLCLPLWIAMQSREWICVARKAGTCRYTSLFSIAPSGNVELEQSMGGHLLFDDDGSVRERYVSVSTEEDGHVLVLTIDCAISIRNLLPTYLQWELADVSKPIGLSIETTDKTNPQRDLLASGEMTEIFSKGHETTQLRFWVSPATGWSTWVPLAIVNDIGPKKPKDTTGSDMYDESVVVREAKLVDSLGISMKVSVRIATKFQGVDVVVFTELWCCNCTSLPVVFGCPQDEIVGSDDRGAESEPSVSELSAAEAALKEISSLFELGEDGKGIARERANEGLAAVDILRVPGQTGSSILEECFEYIEVEYSSVKRRWWASENPRSLRHDMTKIENCDGVWQWIQDSWVVDDTGQTSSGWESSANLEDFSMYREFNPAHPYRRRRWSRLRSGESDVHRINFVNAFYRPSFQKPQRRQVPEKMEEVATFQVAMQVEGGRWALTSKIPSHGSTYGVVRAARARWPRITRPLSSQKATDRGNSAVYEFCYVVSPLEGAWGELTSVMFVTSRFVLRNDSSQITFEVKQSGADDSSAVQVGPGAAIPFHWANLRLPELISIRPVVSDAAAPMYRWSGGLDPLTIGVVPIRVRRKGNFYPENPSHEWTVRSVQVEAEIRPKTGRTGINICFKEEDRSGLGALFRVENRSCFPVWFAQDGILVNHRVSDSDIDTDADLVRPSDSLTFALDVPFRQGKYAGRRAATMSELLRLRIGLAPLYSRGGIETTKVIGLTNAGETVRLSPGKLMFLSAETRSALRRVRVLALVINDGPTRVLRLSLMAKNESESLFVNPFSEEPSSPSSEDPPKSDKFQEEIISAANEATIMAGRGLPTEDESVEQAFLDLTNSYAVDAQTWAGDRQSGASPKNDLIISFRAAFQGLVVSLIDSAPSEICVISLSNVNALATWNMLRTATSTAYITITSLQIDNMVPNAPFAVAVSGEQNGTGDSDQSQSDAPLLVVGISFAPRHKSGIVCLRSVTIAPRNLAIRIDLAFLIRLQRYVLDLLSHFHRQDRREATGPWMIPNIQHRVDVLESAATSAAGRQKFYLGGLTVLPYNIKLSVAPARALTPGQAALEGDVAAALHRAVRKGDLKLGDTHALLGVKVGHRNATPLAVARGVFKSIVVDALLRLDGAQLNFGGVSLLNHITTGSQLVAYLGAHYVSSLRQNVPALLGSLAVFGNPLGLVRGLGDGASDFVLEPVKGFQKSVQEMDASYLVDGVARGTLSLARHTVGGFADSAAMLTETFSKNMTVLTLDRRYAQKRDRKDILREQEGTNVGIGSGVQKLAQGFIEGVTGVVKAPLRGAEKKGFEGFAKGIGKGLLGLLVKPIIGISDGITDVMIGVKSSVDRSSGSASLQLAQIRPRRPLYGADRMIRAYNVADAAAAALLLRTRLAGENYLAHLDMGDRVALLSVKRMVLLGPEGQELLVLKYRHIESLEVRDIEQPDGTEGWGIVVILNTPRRNGSEVEVINCKDKTQATDLCQLMEQGMKLVALELPEQEQSALVPTLPRPGPK